MTTPITLTGPDACAQCGGYIDMAPIVAGFEQGLDLSNPAYVDIRGHKVEIPGLYWDAKCAAGIKSGQLESTLTYGAALAWLDDTFGPQVTGHGMKAAAAGDEGMTELAAARLADVLEVSFILEGVIQALEDDPVNGLDFIIPDDQIPDLISALQAYMSRRARQVARGTDDSR